jgi:hypothetical protein
MPELDYTPRLGVRFSKEMYLGSVCFVVKYFLENIFKFTDACFTIKWWLNEK